MSEVKNGCLNCGEEIVGRKGKKYCGEYCKSNFHYEKNKGKGESLFKSIDKQLKLNRKILSVYNKAGKSTVRAEVLLKAGFNPGYFTNYWKNNKGDVYLFAYEFGFLKRKERGGVKYVLVTWQKYMEGAA